MKFHLDFLGHLTATFKVKVIVNRMERCAIAYK